MKSGKASPQDALPIGIAKMYRQFVDGTLPLFVDRGWDGHAGLVERLGTDLKPDATMFRRSMVHGRQLYVYSIWAEHTDQAVFKVNADRIFDNLVAQFYDSQNGGWIESTTLNGQPLSTRRVLYSHAFILFALTAYRYCLGQERAAPYLDHTLDYIDQHFKNPSRGYHSLLDPAGSDISEGIEQNPIMHLLEALLFLFEKAPTDATLKTAQGIIEFVVRSFLYQGMIIEHLTHDCEPHPETGHNVEPGHQFEWAWLLNWYGQLSGDRKYDDVCKGLIENGLRLGWDQKRGGVFAEVDRHSGAVTLPTKRIWPLEELIKAVSACPQHFRSVDIDLPSLTDFLCRHYLNTDGSWFEQLNEDLSVADRSLRASTCYHTSSALWEALKTAQPTSSGTD